MVKLLYSIGIYGDIHLSSKNYGAHRDYPNESLHYFSEITRITREKGLTHLVGTGDFTFGRFHSLEYRMEVEKNLYEQYKLVNGNRYELRGNHDEAGYGLTERDYYVKKGLLKPSTNLNLGSLNLTMVDYGKIYDIIPNIEDKEDKANFIICHDYVKFNKTSLPNFGKAIILDELKQWFGADYIIAGHIHKIIDFDGYMTDGNNNVHNCKVHYMGCMTRPSYQSDIDEIGQILIIKVYDDGSIDTEFEDIKLWEISDSFNLELKQKEKEKEADKLSRINISDIVKQLDNHDRSIGSPETIIENMIGIDDKYKKKAIELLKNALS